MASELKECFLYNVSRSWARPSWLFVVPGFSGSIFENILAVAVCRPLTKSSVFVSSEKLASLRT